MVVSVVLPFSDSRTSFVLSYIFIHFHLHREGFESGTGPMWAVWFAKAAQEEKEKKEKEDKEKN